eukprot:6202717-Pleurochrysis_carterae.AAC.3
MDVVSAYAQPRILGSLSMDTVKSSQASALQPSSAGSIWEIRRSILGVDLPDTLYNYSRGGGRGQTMYIQ